MGEAIIFNLITHLSSMRACFQKRLHVKLFAKDLFDTKLLQTVHKAREIVLNKALDQIYRSLIEDKYKINLFGDKRSSYQ